MHCTAGGTSIRGMLPWGSWLCQGGFFWSVNIQMNDKTQKFLPRILRCSKNDHVFPPQLSMVFILLVSVQHTLDGQRTTLILTFTGYILRLWPHVWFSESGGDRERESGYFPLKRRGDGERQMEEVNKPSYRFYERGHTLPSNYILEPKACVPYRNINLGVPSQMRNPETYMQDTWRSESPERYTYHSNFRRGTDSQGNSPTRHSSVSPDHYKLIEPSVGTQRRMSLCRNQLLSHGSSELPSLGPSQHTSGRSSPARRRKSIGSHAASPFRPTPSHKHTDSLHLQNDEYDAHRECGRESRNQSQISNKHSLDSEKLYRNLESISCCGSSVIHQNSYEGYKASPETTTAVNSSANTHSCNSPEVSLSRNCYSTHSHTPQREPQSRDSRMSLSQSPWQGSSHSLHSLPLSHGSFTSRQGAHSQVLVDSFSCAAVTKTDKGLEGNNKVSVDRTRSNLRRGMEALLTFEPEKATVELGEVRVSHIPYFYQSKQHMVCNVNVWLTHRNT